MAKRKKLNKAVKTETTYRIWWPAGKEDFKDKRDALMHMEFLQDYVDVHLDEFDRDIISFQSEK